MKTSYFTDNEYNTDPGHINDGRSGSSGHSRLWFTIKFLKTVFRSRKLALRGHYDYDDWARSSMDIMRLLERCGARFHITGFDKFSHLDEPVVFISNHMSTLETMVFPGLIAPFLDVSFVVKESLVSMPLFGPIMRSRDPIVVSRSNSREDLLKVINEGGEKLASGISLIIFPQSTRRDYFDRHEFNSLGVKLAQRSNCKIVPVAIRTDFWENGKLIKDLGPFNRNIPVNIRFGDLLTVTGNGRDEYMKMVNFISSGLKEWGVKIVDHHDETK